MPDPAPAPRDVPVVPAATVMLLRDGAVIGAGANGTGPSPRVPDEPGTPASRLEVALLRRNAGSVFVGGASLFPGGSLDAADGDTAALARCDGLDDAAASERLGLPAGGLAHWVAAVREAFEECALLLARQAGGRPLRFDDPAVAERFAAHRAAVDAGTRTLADVLAEEDLRLACDELHYVSHWVTPVGAPRRYDTRFFVGRAPAGQPLAHDGSEVVAAEWVAPADALARLAAGELSMLPPTSESLRWLAEFASVDDVLAAASAIEQVPRLEPRFVTELDGSTRIVLGDAGDWADDRSFRR